MTIGDTRTYCALRAAEEAERAEEAADPAAVAAHRKLQRHYVERASVGDRLPAPEIVG